MKSALACALFVGLVLAARLASWTDVFIAGEVYFADPDCYSRMTRARAVYEQPGTILRTHSFENAPGEVRPHTTLVMDYLIAGLAWSISGLSAHALDLAGAFVGPLLAVAGGLYLWWWAGQLHLPGRWAMMILYAASPILAHGTMLGRPDHQALLIPLLAVALCSEWALGINPGRPHALAGGIAWGLALWTSLYEPAVLFAGANAVALVSLRQRYFSRDRAVLLSVALAIGALALTLEGWRFAPPAGELFNRWKTGIGELARVPPDSPLWWIWGGWGAALTAAGLAIRRNTWPWLAGLIALTVLTMWQARWGYFFALLLSVALPVALSSIRRWRWVWLALWCAGLWPVLAEWDASLFGRERERALLRSERVELRRVADRMVENGGGIILAPWWLSPAIAYWTGSPCVAGSSHESLPGIADTARFWVAASTDEAQQIVRERNVRWVVVDDPGRTLPGAAHLLGMPGLPEMPMGRLLYERPSHRPPWAGFVETGTRFKLYRID